MTIQVSVSTHHAEEDIRTFVDKHLLQRPDVRAMITSATWHGSVMNVISPFGTGTLTVSPGLLDIHMDLSPFGMAVRSRIEEGLAKAARKLDEYDSTQTL